ncbi:MAG: DNA repair and recombination protein RadB [Halobacteriales archaeon]
MTGDDDGPGSISTGCAALDSLLGGGIDRGAVTQFYGPPASGKTNVALSTAVEVASNDGTAVYIDTEDLSIDRFRQLADGRNGETTVDELASRVVIKGATTFDQQRTAVSEVEELSEQADLIVLDSATGFYRLERSGEQESGESLREVARQVAHLLSLARRFDLAILVTNQVYTDPETDRLRPLGGQTLAHWTGIVVRLERFRGGNRRATLEKHRSQATGDSIRFKITGSGLVGAESDTV